MITRTPQFSKHTSGSHDAITTHFYTSRFMVVFSWTHQSLWKACNSSSCLPSRI